MSSGGIHLPTARTREDRFKAAEPHIAAQQTKLQQLAAVDRADRLSQIRAGRQQDMAEGRQEGERLFGEGSLGRVDQGRAGEIAGLIEQRRQAQSQADRSPLIAAILAQRQAGLEGFQAPELAAQRAQALQGISQGQQTAMRQLRGAQSQAGVQGALAGAQQAQVINEAQKARTQAEQDLFIKNVAQKQAALGALEGSATGAEGNEFNRGYATLGALEQTIGGARAEELGREQFNLAQSQKERFGQLAAQMGYGALGAGERAAVGQELVGEKQAQAAAEAGRGGKK